MLAIGQGSTNSITSSIESTGANLLTVWPGFSRTAGPVSGGRGSARTLTVEDVSAIATDVGQIAAIAPEVDGRYQVVATSGNTNTQVIGTVPAYTEVHKIDDRGWFVLHRRPERERLPGGRARARQRLPTSSAIRPAVGTDPVGQTIRIKGLAFTVIGVTASKGGTGFNSPDDAIFVPLSDRPEFLAGQTKYVSSIGVEAATQDAMTQVQTDITDLLLSRHKIADSASADFFVINQADLAASLSSTTKTLTLLLAAVAGISLIVGGIGIMNMMLTTVTERTREIGLRKAIGAKRRDVSVQFLVEAVVLTFSSGIIGVVLGCAGRHRSGRSSPASTRR